MHRNGLSCTADMSSDVRVMLTVTSLSVITPPVSVYILTSSPESNRACRVTPLALNEDELIVSENVSLMVPRARLNCLNC